MRKTDSAKSTGALTAERIRAKLKKEYADMAIEVFESIDSTNTEAKRRAEAPAPFLIAADSQTAGRGRLGRSFYSPEGTGLYMTLVLNAEGLENAVCVTCMAAVAVSRAIERLTGRETGIKWVNDIYMEGKKVCGILTEGIFGKTGGELEKVAVGIGVNITTESFPEGIIAAGTGRVDRAELAAEIASGLADIIKTGDWLEYYRKRSLVIGREILYIKDGEERRATAVMIDEYGGLIVEAASGMRTALRTGEITLRLGADSLWK